MAGRAVARSCVQTGLKMVNSIVGLAGMAVILYALWMLRAWSRQVAELHQHFPVPWFIYAFLALGIILCLLTCAGHIAAETATGHCLSCHMIFVCFLVILEGAITADVFLNSNWEEDFPYDPSGKFDEFKHFVRSNFEICEWVGLSVVASQAISIILAMVLRSLGPDREIDFDSDDDAAVPARLPLLRNQAQHGPNYIEPNLSRRSDSWNLRILGKMRCYPPSTFFHPYLCLSSILTVLVKPLNCFPFRLTNKIFPTLHGKPVERRTDMFCPDPRGLRPTRGNDMFCPDPRGLWPTRGNDTSFSQVVMIHAMV